jgi:hypothetical protein
MPRKNGGTGAAGKSILFAGPVKNSEEQFRTLGNQRPGTGVFYIEG